jgi:TetR/AcrR family transcriptional regulator, cholesterol catabolism regulator
MSQNSINQGAFTPQKEAILDTAREIFARHGFEGLSIRDLASQCGLAKATIYHHFRDKQEIFISVLERDVGHVHTQVLNAATNECDALDKLRVVIHTYCRLISERRSVVLTTLREITGMEARLRRFAQVNKEYFLGPLAQIIQQGIDEGRFRPVDTEMSALSLLGMLHAFVTFQLVVQDREIGSDVAEHVLHLFVHGIGRPDSQAALQTGDSADKA